MVKRIVIAAAIALLWPGIALADSDGYYCVGKGFVAYEMSFSQAPGKHLLHIVRVSHRTGLSRLPAIPLVDFQVHGMTCREDGVDLQGWTARYSVDISRAGKPTVTSVPVAFDQSIAQPQANLGMLARPGVTEIPSDGPSGEFQLIVAQVTRKTPSGVDEYYTIAQILQRDFKAPVARQVVASDTLYTGIAPRGGE